MTPEIIAELSFAVDSIATKLRAELKESVLFLLLYLPITTVFVSQAALFPILRGVCGGGGVRIYRMTFARIHTATIRVAGGYWICGCKECRWAVAR